MINILFDGSVYQVVYTDEAGYEWLLAERDAFEDALYTAQGYLQTDLAGFAGHVLRLPTMSIGEN